MSALSKLAIDDEERQQCPNPNCGVILAVGQLACLKCQETVQHCWRCQTLGRLLARYCRLCRARLVSNNNDTEVVAQPGLILAWDKIARVTEFAGANSAVDPLDGITSPLDGVTESIEPAGPNTLTLDALKATSANDSIRTQDSEVDDLERDDNCNLRDINNFNDVNDFNALDDHLNNINRRNRTSEINWGLDIADWVQLNNFIKCTKLVVNWELGLATPIVAVPLGLRGIIVLITLKGQILLIAEATGRVCAELFAGERVAFTPVVVENLLIVATDRQVVAFDLLAAIYGQMAGRSACVWRQALPANAQIAQPLIASPATLWVTTRTENQLLFLAMAPQTGKLQARWAVSATNRRFTAPFLLATGALLINDQGANQVTNQLTNPDNQLAAPLATQLADNGNPNETSNLQTNNRGNQPAAGKVGILTNDGTLIIAAVVEMQTQALGLDIDTNVWPVVTADNVWIVAVNGQIKTIPIGTGAMRRFAAPQATIINAISVGTNALAVAHVSGLLVYDHQGQLQWETALDGNSIQTPPLVLAEGLLVVDDAGTLFGFSPRSSSPRWRQRIADQGRVFPLLLTRSGLIVVTTLGQIKCYRAE